MAESNAPLSDNELCQTFKTVKLLVWSNANITSFVGVLKHLEEHGPIHLNHGDWVYKLSVTLRCLVASSAAKNLEFPVCVYKDCSTPPVSGRMCAHLKNESTFLYYRGLGTLQMDTEGMKAIGSNGIITSHEIEHIYSMLADFYGMSLPLKRVQHQELCNLIGQRPFSDKTLGITVSRVKDHSFSLRILTYDGKFEFFTCGRFKCYSPAFKIGPLDVFCAPHCVVKSGLTHLETRDMTTAAYAEIANFEEPLPEDTVFKRAYRKLYKLGSQGYRYSHSNATVILSVNEGMQLKREIFPSRSLKYTCMDDKCNKAVSGGFSLEATKMTLFCDSHQGKKIDWILEVKKSLKYGIDGQKSVIIPTVVKGLH